MLNKTYLFVALVMAGFVALNLVAFPQIYSSIDIGIAKPVIDVQMPQQATQGKPFEIKITANNLGADADLQSVTVEFPSSQNMDNVKIVSYDFLQSPKFFLSGKQVGSSYNGNKNLVESQYPFLEAYDRPSKTGHLSSMILEITPTEPGTMIIYTKTVAMPHVSEMSHFPKQGILDQQNEFVQEHKITVLPSD